MNATCEPSGSQRGVFSLLSPPTSSRGAADPSAGTIQMSAFRLPVATSVVVRTNSTWRPSGESCGSLTRTAPSKSWMVMGRAAAAGAAHERSAAAHAAARETAVMTRIVGRVSGPGAGSFRAQRDEGIHGHRAPGRQIAGDKGNGREEDRHADEAEGI